MNTSEKAFEIYKFLVANHERNYSLVDYFTTAREALRAATIFDLAEEDYRRFDRFSRVRKALLTDSFVKSLTESPEQNE